ncbi:MAG: hypothetical protein IPI39_11910 [Candidatus Obscuribacter sp.]|nr:hypothetical protein [Candidatus Obscuribacter sp.]
MAPGNIKDEQSLKKFITKPTSPNTMMRSQKQLVPNRTTNFTANFAILKMKELFDGNKQYDCVYDTLVSTDLALRDVTKRRAFYRRV